MSDIFRLLRRAQPGSSRAVLAHIRRGEHLADLIETRFAVRHPVQWHAKHVRWVLEHGLGSMSHARRYDYFRTARVIAAALGHWLDWQPYLVGPWCSPIGDLNKNRHAGGRPPKLQTRAARKGMKS